MDSSGLMFITFIACYCSGLPARSSRQKCSEERMVNEKLQIFHFERNFRREIRKSSKYMRSLPAVEMENTPLCHSV
jgi:hypothetical protein